VVENGYITANSEDDVATSYI
jgi:hypothetical protein